MVVFERFTDRARRVIVLAQEEARMFNADYVGTGHILLGLLGEGEGVAARSLESLGISLEIARTHVEHALKENLQALAAEDSQAEEPVSQVEQTIGQNEPATEALQGEEPVGRRQQAPRGHIPFNKRVKKVLELALRESLGLNHNYIGTEHLLLGVIREGEGVGAQVLIKLGADLTVTRARVIELLSRSTGTDSD
jgi:ATP-dependent Clp protease ATP-binding subunit ClpC